VIAASERRQTSRHEHDIVQAGGLVLVEVAPQPACPGAAMPAWILEGDQRRELQRFLEVQLPELTRSDFRNGEVAALDGAVEDRSRLPSGGDRSLLPGAGRCEPSGSGERALAQTSVVALRHRDRNGKRGHFDLH
jgi:hypothetical protein